MVASFTYGFPVAQDAFREAGVELLTLSNYNAVLAEALRTGYIKESDMELLNAWRQDPANWNAE
jgi:orotate phosphoribosyltransferase